MDSLNKNEKSTAVSKRMVWERPVLRRLGANKAEGSGIQVDDGNCVGTGSAGHHVCLS
jgi:hypothetical protein